ncbi:MAG TPA: DUF2460 domain-containing protein [Bryobacteraceae bacterium]|nr:DUF2460 domain-containing protein [Bryobacteraceae bacterium]
MSDFPRLKTGVPAQYPAEASIAYRTRVTRFVDGREQRYRQMSSPVRRWTIRLDLLDDEEARLMQHFFEEQQGSFAMFPFTDPHTGLTYPACSFDLNRCTVEQRGESRSKTTLVIRTVS